MAAKRELMRHADRKQRAGRVTKVTAAQAGFIIGKSIPSRVASRLKKPGIFGPTPVSRLGTYSESTYPWFRIWRPYVEQPTADIDKPSVSTSGSVSMKPNPKTAELEVNVNFPGSGGLFDFDFTFLRAATYKIGFFLWLDRDAILGLEIFYPKTTAGYSMTVLPHPSLQEFHFAYLFGAEQNERVVLSLDGYRPVTGIPQPTASPCHIRKPIIYRLLAPHMADDEWGG